MTVGDPWICKDIRWTVAEVKSKATPNAATLETRVHWSSPRFLKDKEEVPIVEERAVIRVYRSRSNNSDAANQQAKRSVAWQVIDFEIRLRAMLEDVQIGGSENVKGYGGFSTRIRLPHDIAFSSSDGVVKAQTTAISAGISLPS